MEEDTIKIIEKDGKKYFYSKFVAELSDEKIEMNKENLKRTYNKLKQLIEEEKNVEAKIQQKIKELEEEYLHSMEALRDYNKYEKKMIRQLKKKREKIKKQLQDFVTNYKEIRKNIIEQMRKQSEEKIKAYMLQLRDTKRGLELYGEKVED